MLDQYEKALITLRYWLYGSRMHLALRAFEYAAKFHTGFRKDGVTPEYYHQLSITRYLRTLINHLDYPEETLAASCLHDVCEDKDVGFEEIETKFGTVVSNAVVLLTKKHRGSKIPTEIYYGKLSENPIASIVKGGDRINNIQTMTGVFSKEKQIQYLSETSDFVLPMLKTARRKFTTQEPAYENQKLMIQNQMDLIRELHRSAENEG